MSNGAGVLNQCQINAQAINSSDYRLRVASAAIALYVNKAMSSVIGTEVINSNRVNGLATNNNVSPTQTHVLVVNDAVLALTAESPAPYMIYQLTVQNAYMALVVGRVYLQKGVAGHLFVTVTEPDSTVHRFSFEGVKA